MDKLTTFVTSMVALSVGVERIVEILKSMFPGLGDGKSPGWVRGFAVIVGTAIALVVGPHGLFDVIPPWGPGHEVQYIGGAVLLGLLGAGGSAFWNHILDILGALKKVKEADAKVQVERSKAALASLRADAARGAAT